MKCTAEIWWIRYIFVFNHSSINKNTNFNIPNDFKHNIGSKRRTSACDFWNTIAVIQKKRNTSTSKWWGWSNTRGTARRPTTTTSHCCVWKPMGWNSDPTPVFIRSVCRPKVTAVFRTQTGLWLPDTHYDAAVPMLNIINKYDRLPLQARVSLVTRASSPVGEPRNREVRRRRYCTRCTCRSWATTIAKRRNTTRNASRPTWCAPDIRKAKRTLAK